MVCPKNCEDSNVKTSDFIKIKHLKPKNKLSKMKCVFLEWSHCVTYHCFPKIFKEKTHLILRLFWSVIFLSFASLTFFILVNNVILYYQYQTVTSIQIINEQPTLFPTITICDSNVFTTQDAQLFLVNMSKNFFDKDITTMSYLEYYEFGVNQLSNVVYSFVSDPMFGDENRKRLGFNLSQFILTCTFHFSSACNFNQDFHWFFHFDYGNCYQFNSGFNMSNHVVDLKTVTFGSKSNGFSLRFGPLITHNKYPLTFSKGLKIFVHNQSIAPNIFYNSLSIEPGKETDIVIERTVTSNKPWPYSGCIDLSNGFNSEYYRVITSKLNKTYFQDYCLTLCTLQKNVEEECKCYSTAFDPFKSSNPCINKTQLACLNRIYAKISSNLDFYSSECQQESCPLECDSYAYNTKVASLEFPSLEFYNLLKSNATTINQIQNEYGVDISSYDLYRQYFYSLNFYYSTSSYTYISQSPQMTLINLLSNLGGSLGMFLGMSIFSLIEVVEILARLALAWFSKN